MHRPVREHEDRHTKRHRQTRRVGGGGGSRDPEIQTSRDSEIQRSRNPADVFPRPKGHYIHNYIYIKLIDNISTTATQNTPPPMPKASSLDQAWGRRIHYNCSVWHYFFFLLSSRLKTHTHTHDFLSLTMPIGHLTTKQLESKEQSNSRKPRNNT